MHKSADGYERIWSKIDTLCFWSMLTGSGLFLITGLAGLTAWSWLTILASAMLIVMAGLFFTMAYFMRVRFWLSKLERIPELDLVIAWSEKNTEIIHVLKNTPFLDLLNTLPLGEWSKEATMAVDSTNLWLIKRSVYNLKNFSVCLEKFDWKGEKGKIANDLCYKAGVLAPHSWR